MKTMFIEICALEHIHKTILDSEGYNYRTKEGYNYRTKEGYNYRTKEGYEYACKEYGEDLLRQRSFLVEDILSEILDKNQKYAVLHYKASWGLKCTDVKFCSEISGFLEDRNNLHHKFLINYINGKYEQLPKTN